MQAAATDARIVHFLVHVPKCAGTTIELHLKRHLGDRFLWAPRWRSPLRDVIGNRYPGLDPAALSGVQAVSGHSLSTGLREKFPGAEIRESVILRDPVSWHLSMYRYRLRRLAEGSTAPTFDQWYRTVRRNPVSRFLLNRYFEQGVPALYRLSSRGRLAFLEERLAGFHFVGGLDRTDELIARVSQELGIPGRAERENIKAGARDGDGEIDTLTLERVREDNRLDQALYDRWASRGWHQDALPAPPPLPAFDQPGFIAGDIRSGVLRELGG